MPARNPCHASDMSKLYTTIAVIIVFIICVRFSIRPFQKQKFAFIFRYKEYFTTSSTFILKNTSKVLWNPLLRGRRFKPHGYWILGESSIVDIYEELAVYNDFIMRPCPRSMIEYYSKRCRLIPRL